MPQPNPDHPLIAAIISDDPNVRDRSVWDLTAGWATPALLDACDQLDAFRRESANLYERVRATIFLHALYRYRLQEAPDVPPTGIIPHAGVADLMQRRFESAISAFLAVRRTSGLNSAIASALAHAYEQLTYQTLADQVRRSVRSCAGNRWMFRVGAPEEHPARLISTLFERTEPDGLFPILIERTPVRLDLSHSAWSDIFFLGMDYPEGARVLNISVDLAVHGRDDRPLPPIETYCRVIDEPLLRLTSIDLEACKDVSTLSELFNFGNDYLGLVKAGVIASGLVPPSFEGTGYDLAAILGRVIRPGYGLEVVSKVNDIPKGSRLAVSTNLLASLIALLMRATGQARNATGPLERDAARVVVARAILGEWLGGSGGGWQDSGGVFPGVKLIEGVVAGEDDPEWRISRGRLLPTHLLLTGPGASESNQESTAGNDLAPTETPAFHDALARSLVLVHGGMAQNVGPILNMVTERYLLRSREEWQARREATSIFERIVEAVRAADPKALGALTTANWEGPLKGIIPWVSNRFTESLIAEVKRQLGADFWGFLMLGGMSGGGMGFFVAPHRHAEFRDQVLSLMHRTKRELDDALPFAMEPVVYDFHINPHGTAAELRRGAEAMMPGRYYSLQVPRMIAAGESVALPRKNDLDHFAAACPDVGELLRTFRTTLNKLFPVTHAAGDSSASAWDRDSEQIKQDNGFDPIQHEQLRADLIKGRIGVARNRMSVAAEVRDVDDADLIFAQPTTDDACWTLAVSRGEEALQRGEAAVVTLAGGLGTRWTTGAGVVKAVNPFVMLEGRHRGFLEIHLAKTRRAMQKYETIIPHIISTSFLTHNAIERHLSRSRNYGHEGPVYLSRGQSIAQRLVPMARDLQYIWEESAQEVLDENKQKVREASRHAILDWARAAGEGRDYTDNVPIQRFNPPGHFHEVPNLLRNGTLARVLDAFPNVRWLLVHNVDTLGASLDPGVLGRVLESNATLAFEVVPRRIDDRGGGLARVNGRLRLVEGLALPHEELEFDLRYYNSLTTWVEIDRLLKSFGLTRDQVRSSPKIVAQAIRAMAARLPTYVTIKDVKRRWGHGQEDVFPVAQFEKLWGDLTSIPELACAYLVVPRPRGQQLKDPSQLDGWVIDGGCEAIAQLCAFPDRS